MFVAITSETTGTLYVSAIVNVRDGTSIVTAVRRSDDVPIAIFVEIDDDDRHDVDSVPDAPTRVSTLVDMLVKSRPTTVTVISPVAAMFVIVVELGSTTSNVTTEDTVPTCDTIVTHAERDGDIPSDTRPRNALVDTHDVDPKPLPPIRPPMLYSHSPLPTIPTTVTLCDPVHAAFVNTTLLNDKPSCDIAAPTLPENPVTVVANDRAVRTPAPGFIVMLDDDTHAVASVALPPNRATLEDLH